MARHVSTTRMLTRARLSGTTHAIPPQAELQQVLAQAVRIVDDGALGARLVEEPAPRIGKRVRLLADLNHGLKLQAVEQVQRLGGAGRQQLIQRARIPVSVRRWELGSHVASRQGPCWPGRSMHFLISIAVSVVGI